MSRARKQGLMLTLALVVFVFGVTMLSLISSVIWPGEAKLLAPILCDDARPDAFVVTDTYSSGAGETSTNFTMYCVGPRGDHRDVGWFKPYLGITIINGLVIALLIAAFSIRPLRRRRRAAQAAAAASMTDRRPAPERRSPPRPGADDLPPGITSVSDAVPSDDTG